MTSMTDDKILNVFIQYVEKTGRLPWDNGLVEGLELVGGIGASGRAYTGFNALLTAMAIAIGEYDSRQFLTFAEIKKRGGSVKKGSSAWVITSAVFKYFNEDGKQITEKEAKELKAKDESVTSKFCGYHVFPVFNLAQTTLEYKHEERINVASLPSNVDTTAEQLVEAYRNKPAIKFGLGTPHYSPMADEVVVPPSNAYKSKERYYSTLYHELVHSTGHKDRLARTFAKKHGDATYAKEELVAEIGASMLCNKAGLDPDKYLDNSGAYVQSWIQSATTNDKFGQEIITAWKNAQKAVHYMLGETA